MRPLPLKSEPSTEWNLTIAPYFFFTMSYSLFSVDDALGGFKTPAISFYYRHNWRRRLAWHGVSGWFEIQRPFFYFITLMLILLYIVYSPFYVQSAQMAHLVKAFIGKHWDLGSNPRSLHIISIILFNPFPCSASFSSPSYTQRLCLPCVPDDPSSGQEPRVHGILQSTRKHVIQKVRKGPHSNGLNSSNHLLNWGQHPPQFAFCFLFFSLFFLFIFVLFLIKFIKTIFIKQKSEKS